MVDLAGSEREVSNKARPDFGDSHSLHGRSRDSTGDSDTRTLSQRLRETAQIKKALSNLGIIIKGLSRGDSAVGLPFRDSVLTWLLKVGDVTIALYLVAIQEALSLQQWQRAVGRIGRRMCDRFRSTTQCLTTYAHDALCPETSAHFLSRNTRLSIPVPTVSSGSCVHMR